MQLFILEEEINKKENRYKCMPIICYVMIGKIKEAVKILFEKRHMFEINEWLVVLLVSFYTKVVAFKEQYLLSRDTSFN